MKKVFTIGNLVQRKGSLRGTLLLLALIELPNASRKILMFRIWKTNSEPSLVGKWYLDLLHAHKVLPHHIRIDKRTETNAMTTIRACLRGQLGDFDDPTDSVIFGPSPSNQVLSLHLDHVFASWFRKMYPFFFKSYYKNFLLSEGSNDQKIVEKILKIKLKPPRVSFMLFKTVDIFLCLTLYNESLL